MSLSLDSVRQGPNAKRVRGRGNGRVSGNPRFQTNRNNGPAVRVHGNARQAMEKYRALAQQASSAGDRITAEGYFQHAEHYYRVMTANGRDLDEPEPLAQPQPASFKDKLHPDLGGNDPDRL